MTSKPTLSKLALLSVLTVAACRATNFEDRLPGPPAAPAVRMQTVAEAVADDLTASTYWSGGAPRPLRGATLGLLGLGGGEGAAEATDGLRSRLQEMASEGRLDLLDPGRMDALAYELGLRGLGDIDAARRVADASDPPAADYLILADVTDYRIESATVAVAAVFEPGEIERYEEEYASYMQQMDVEINELGQYAEMDVYGFDQEFIGQNEFERRGMAEDVRARTVSPDAYRERAASMGRDEHADVARVAIEVRLVDVSAGESAWIYSGHVTDIALEDGLDRLLDDLVERMTAE